MTVAPHGKPRPAGAPPAGRARPQAAQVLYGLAAAFLATAVVSAFMSAASAAGGGGGGNWGPTGSSGPTDSSVTVRWDNTAPGQPAYDKVRRDSSQILPYTGGATYIGANTALSAQARQVWGNLSVTVDQTKGLGHQAVSLSYTGVANPTETGAFLDVFQCWGGGLTVDGVRADEPDPSHCETGNRFLAAQDAALVAKGDLPSPLGVTVSGYEDSDGTGVHLWAQVESGNGLAPASGTVQFATLTGQKLGKPVRIAKGIASAVISGLAKGASNEVIATYTPAKDQNYQPAVPSAPLTLPEAFSQGQFPSVDTLVSNDPGLGSTLYSGSLADVAAAAGTFKPGDKVSVTLNFGDGESFHSQYGFNWDTPNAAGAVRHLATVVAASDGSATAAITTPSPSSLPPNPKGAAYGYVLVFTDEAHPSAQVVDFAGISDFQPPLPVSVTSSNQAPHNSTDFMPFNDIEGHPQANGISDFTSATSNELDNWQAPATSTGTTTREFTVSTTVQDPNLGCGVEAGAPSTSTCWLVLVPSGIAGFSSPLTPSLWAQRLQVKLSFAPIPAFCSASFHRVIGIGSELLTSALSSWVPAICARNKVNIGFLPVADSIARQQYEQGVDSLIFTSQPVDDKVGGTRSLYAPVGLSGVTIGLNLPTFTGQVTDLRLDARLVAKLLTQSYTSGIDPGAAATAPANDPAPYGKATGGERGILGFAPWAASTEFKDLFADPEFQTLNPGFSYSPPIGFAAFDNIGSLLVSSTASDPIGVLWRWLLSDPEAKAFLDGCPDTAATIKGQPTVVNPFFSTGSYAECRSQAGPLRQSARQEITLTTTRYRKYARAAAADLAHILPIPQSFGYTYTYTPVTYSASNPQFPLPAWYVIPTNGVGFNWTAPNTSANLHSEEASLANVEADISLGAMPWLVNWCDRSCTTPPFGSAGVWAKETANYFNPMLGITDTPAAAQFQTVTARLCDDSGHCAGADAQSLLKAESEFKRTSAPGVLQTSMRPDEAHGAYPLTVPVYAAVNIKGLSDTDAAAYAAMLRYISTAGNQPGLTPGLLPPGYAPLPPGMLARDAAAVRTLDKLAKAHPTPTPTRSPTRTPTQSPSHTSTSPTGGTSAASSSPPPTVSSSPGTSSPAARTSSPATSRTPSSSGPGPSPSATTSAPFRAVTPGTLVDFPEYGVVGGLVGAVVCAGIAPFVGRGRRLPTGRRVPTGRRGPERRRGR